MGKLLLLVALLLPATAYAKDQIVVLDKDCHNYPYGIYCAGTAMNLGPTDAKNVVIRLISPVEHLVASDSIDYLPAREKMNFKATWEYVRINPNDTVFTPRGRRHIADIESAIAHGTLITEITFESVPE